jgi:hypothetical protein
MPPSDAISSLRAPSASMPLRAASSSISPVAPSVWTQPGATRTTRTPFGPTSFDSALL